ncbi:MAG: ABC transporter ATP-binding protein [Bacteroidales bacterium]|nr:ABC transporter ATP-binding protein [Bacteroidales bacterium]
MTSSSNKNTAISVKNLCKTYYLGNGNNSSNSITALDNINLEIARGEVIGIIGPNGSGKSTLLKVISEITAPDSGSVLVKGKVASILEVGIGFNPDLSGRKNIFLNASLHQMSRKQISSKLDQIVELFGFPRFLDTPVKQYSSGMYMRLAFAIVASIEADIYLFDEVLSVGDIKFQKASMNRIAELQKAGKTICIVTHTPALITDFIDRLVLLNEGKLIMEGEANEVIYAYKKRILNIQENGDRLKCEITPEELKKRKTILINDNKAFDLLGAHLEVDSKKTAEFISGQAFDVVLLFKTDVSEPLNLAIYIGDYSRKLEVLSFTDKGRVYNNDNVNEYRFKIPQNLFNELHGYIGISVVLNNQVLLYYQNILRFQFSSENKIVKTLGYFSPELGVEVKSILRSSQ